MSLPPLPCGRIIAILFTAWAISILSEAAESPSLTSQRTAVWAGTPPEPLANPAMTNAFLTIHRPPDPNGAAIVICPGGGYGGLVTGPEGTGIARWLNHHRITGIVLEYRLPNGHSHVPLRDAQRTLRSLRAQAAQLGIDPNRIGIMGFSAGGHLASTVATHFDAGHPDAADPVERVSSRPDFSILIYPVISMGNKGHSGSRANLLGPQPTAESILLFSNEGQVTDRTPPAFLAHARDDTAVPPEHSRMFHQALLAKGVPSEYLELPSGGHGLNGYQGPMWDAWQSGALKWLAARQFIPEADAATITPLPAFPSFEDLSKRSSRVRGLTDSSDFIFSLYGSPGDLVTVRQLVETMRSQELGNGFDPGPGTQPNSKAVFEFLAKNRWPVVLYSGGEMQIQGGRAVFGRAQAEVLDPMERANVFNAYQLGEWGYYFHNLAPRESWWRDVYGADFEQFKHLMKPKGLAGYDHRPSDRRECHDIVKNYFQSRARDLLGRVISVTGHSHYEAYAGTWGARCIGLELGENIAFTQSKLAFARGAARASSKPWSVQVSPWFGPACTTSGPMRKEGDITRGLDAGHSLSLYERLWLHSWFAGAAMVTPENSIAIFFEKPEAPWTLTSHGRKAAEVYGLMRSHDRGVPFTPIAIVLDRFAGYNGYMGKPWGILDPTPADTEIRDLFDHQLFPGGDHIHTRPDPENPESSYLRPTPYGELFDVLLSDAPQNILSDYPVIFLAGDISFDVAFLTELENALRHGSQLLLHPRHVRALGYDFARLTQQGAVEVLPESFLPATGRPAAIAPDRLESLARHWAPVEITGDPVQYQFNRTRSSWVVELVNNRGVSKRGNQPAVIDASAVARVQLRPRFLATASTAWRSGKRFQPTETIHVELGPGTTEFIEWSE